MRAAKALLIQAEVVEVDMDFYTQIDRSEPLERSQPGEGHPRVLLAIDSEDVLATPSQKLVDAKIFDMASVRDTEPRCFFIHRAEHLLEKKP